MGMSYPGELRQVAHIGRPDIAVYTNIHPVHLVNFDSPEAITEAKAELLEGLKPGGLVVANGDDPKVMRIASRSSHPLLTYGIDAKADVTAAKIEDLGIEGLAFELNAGGETVRAESPLPGIHNLYNLLAALATGLAVGLEPEAMLAAAKNVSLSPLRSHILPFEEGWTLFNDAYNSNPAALELVLDTVGRSSRFSRKIAVLGDMLELGNGEIEAHRKSGLLLPKVGLDRLIAVGPLAVHLAEGAAEAGMSADSISHVDSPLEALEELKGTIRQDDLVLVKGSRGIKMEAIVEGLKSEFQPRETDEKG
jgi:UDP-N-acetylmuramoyl-tripeptide--D-alanyl-D-alanine ligase